MPDQDDVANKESALTNELCENSLTGVQQRELFARHFETLCNREIAGGSMNLIHNNLDDRCAAFRLVRADVFRHVADVLRNAKIQSAEHGHHIFYRHGF